MRHLTMLLAVAVAAWTAGCTREMPDFERMQTQQRADPYEASAAFADGLVMRVPPSGTVEYAPRTYSAVIATGRQGGEPVDDVPVPVTPELVALGAHHFQTFCAVCHGDKGAGESVMAANMPEKAPPSLLTRDMAAHSAGELFDVVTNGGRRMPPYGWAMPDARSRWAVVAYVQKLQAAALPAAADTR